MVGRPPVLVIDGTKQCSRCLIFHPVEEFDRESSTASGFKAACRKSLREVRADRQEPVGNQTAGRRTTRDSVLFTKYGIREEDYNRMWIEQDGRCLICKVQRIDLCVDHNHKTKKVRGLICRECNFGLGKFADSADRLMTAVAYLLADGT